MKKLWVQLSLMIGGVLFLVFFLQFLSIMLHPDEGGQHPPGGDAYDAAPPQEITVRMLEWLGFSTLVGVAGGILISRVISAPVNRLVMAARQIGKGDLTVRVPARGSLEMIELTETLNKMTVNLERAENLRNNLMADVSHELRTPLTVLEGNLRAALDHVYTLDEAEIANLYAQTRHLIRLVNDLRELSLAETHQLPLEMQPTQPALLITETMQALEPMATEKHITMSADLPDFPVITVDPARLRQVLFNLLANALRHTPPGGSIAIKGEVLPEKIQVSIQDSGDGLEPDQLNAVFDRFYRGDKSRSRDSGGTGLGLAIVKAIIENHGGSIEVFSAGKDQGCTFEIILPVNPA